MATKKKAAAPASAAKNKKNAALIEKWAAIVASVEKGYSFGLFDYRNDLDVRSLIAEAGASAEAAALDKRFQAALTAKKVKVWESDVAGAFWIYGYPKKTNAEFRQDLKAEGLI